MSDSSDFVQQFVSESLKSLDEQTENWLHSLGIRTEADARLLAQDWMIEYDPVEMVDAGDNGVKATQTMRLVRRPKQPEPGDEMSNAGEARAELDHAELVGMFVEGGFSFDRAHHYAKAVVAAGFRKVEITEEMMEKAARAGHEYLRSLRPEDRGPYDSWDELDEGYREYLRGIQRAALSAALS